MSVRGLLWIIFDKAKDHNIIVARKNAYKKRVFVQEDLLKICKWIMEI